MHNTCDVSKPGGSVYISICILCIYTYIYMYICVCTYHIFVCTYMYVYIHVYIHTYYVVDICSADSGYVMSIWLVNFFVKEAMKVCHSDGAGTIKDYRNLFVGM